MGNIQNYQVVVIEDYCQENFDDKGLFETVKFNINGLSKVGIFEEIKKNLQD